MEFLFRKGIGVFCYDYFKAFLFAFCTSDAIALNEKEEEGGKGG